MILAALNDYYQRLLESGAEGVSVPGYSQENISYALVLNEDGKLVDVESLLDLSGKKPQPRSMSVPQPEKRTAGIKPNFFWDKTSYVLGVSATSKRSEQEHAAFIDFHKQVLGETDDVGLSAFLLFLTRWKPEEFGDNPHFQRHGDHLLDTNVVFRLDGEQRYLHECPAARAARSRLLGTESDSPYITCLVTGKSASIARLHPAIKGVNGAQSSGASIVSFNLDSFSSYGKSQGENAPVSKQAAFAYTSALNYLLRRDVHNRQRLQIGDATVVFWAVGEKQEADSAESLFADFMDPAADDERRTADVEKALLQVKEGLPLEALGTGIRDDTRLFVLGLAPNASRLSIRFWEAGTLRSFAEKLARHYDDLSLLPPPWKSPPPIWRLLLATAPSRDGRAKSEDVAPLLAGEMARAILTGGPYPYSLLGTLLMRLRADGDISGVRVALCKAVLARAKRLGQKGISKGELPVSLDTTNTDPGYVLGRLFASLENIQRLALGGQVNATIRDKYYGAASATPAGIFPVLLRNSKHHLSRLRKDKPGLAVVLEKEVEDIVDLLGTSFPRSLRMESQGHFAIGYYHQDKSRFKHDKQNDNQSQEGDDQ